MTTHATTTPEAREMAGHAERGWDDAPGAPEARRKLLHLLAGDYLLYEITADREMLVLRLPTRINPRAAASGRASPRADGAAPPGS